jgi:hypothetical protein
MLYRNNTTEPQEMEPSTSTNNPTTSEQNPHTDATVLRCSIQGTHTRYQMKKVTRANELDKYKSRIATRSWDPSLYEVDTQVQLLRELRENISRESVESDRCLEKMLDTHLLMKKELETKLSGYRFQDHHKKREGHNITLHETIEKLLESRLLCYYCTRQCHVFYERVREMSQWSLDRIDNDLCHSVENVVVACLQCNLHRKNTNSKKFKDTKSMTCVRLLESRPPSPAPTDPLHSTDKSEPFPATSPSTDPLHSTDKSEPFPATRTRVISKKSLQKITHQVVVDDRVIVPIQKELP